MFASDISFSDPEDFDVLSQTSAMSDVHVSKPPAPVAMSTSDNIMQPPISSAAPAADENLKEGQRQSRAEETLSVNSGSMSAYEKHPTFFFDDGNLTFVVHGVMYCVHRYLFARHSAFFSKLFSEDKAVNQYAPFQITDTDCDKFDALLSILYPTNFQDYDVTTVEAWTSVLHLSTKWSFPSIRTLSIDRLEPIASAIDKVILGRTYDIHEWLRPGFVALCDRAQPLTQDEGFRLGVADVILITTVRESMRSRRLDASRVEVENLIKSYLDPCDRGVPEKAGGTEMGGEADELKATEANHRLLQPVNPWGVKFGQTQLKPAWSKSPAHAYTWKGQMSWDKVKAPPISPPSSPSTASSRPAETT